MRSGRRRTPTFRRWCRACSRRSVSSRIGAWRFVAGIGGGMLQFVASLHHSRRDHGIWRGGCPQPARPSSRGSSARSAAPGSSRCPRRPSVRSRRVSSAWPSSRRSRRRDTAGRWYPVPGVLAVDRPGAGHRAVPAVLVTLPVIAYIWMSGDYGTGSAIVYSVLLLVAGMLDNVLKPLMLGRASMRRCRSSCSAQ